jgi:hypothetical protein
MEWETTTGTVSINTTTKRSGAASIRCNPTSGTGYIQHRFRVDSTARVFLRAYVYVASMPTADTGILTYGDGATGWRPEIRLRTNGTLQVWDTGTSAYVGTASSALSTGTWYRVELDYADSLADAVNAYLDGTEFTGGTAVTDMNGGGVIRVGVQTSCTADIYFDDIAVNDDTGTAQTGLPGAGSIVHMQPDSAGDNAAWPVRGGTNSGANWSQVDEITPNDATAYVERSGGVASQPIDDHACESATSAGIGSSDTVTLVHVGIRGGSTSATATGRAIWARVKGQSSGTVLEGASQDLSVNGWLTHTEPVPKTYKLTAYVNPQDSAAWAPSDLDTMQIGYRPTTSNTNLIRVTACWALVEFVPSAGSPHTISMGLITETDTLSPIVPVKDIVKAVGLITETDTLQPMTAVKSAITVALGLIAETDTVSPITPIKNIVKAIGLISETDTTQTFTAVKSSKTANLGLITETDVALGFAMPKFIAVDQIIETDTPLSITPVKAAIAVQLGLITETDTTLAITPIKTIVKALGLITETDAPQPMTVIKDTTVQLGLITETDTTFAVVASKPIVKAMGLIAETDLTFPIDPGGPKVRHLNPIVETDVPLSITPVKTIFKPLGHLVDSAAVASGFTALKAPLTVQLGLVVATDLPLPLALTPPPKLGLDFASSSLSVDVAGRFASTSEGRPGSAGGREGTSTVTNVILDFASSSLSVDVAGRFASTSEGRPGSAGGREGTSTVTNVIDV